MPRTRFGQYAVERFGDAIRESPGKLRVLRGEAVAVEDDAVVLLDGTRLPAEAIVLATGLAPRIAPSHLADDPRIIDAWDECALAALPRDGKLLILGSGLSALDVVALLEAHKFKGSATILSRRGLLPRPHLSPLSPASPLRRELVEDAPKNLRGLLRWGRAVVRETEQRGEPWQHGIDAMRAHVSKLWRGLPPRADRALRPFRAAVLGGPAAPRARRRARLLLEGVAQAKGRSSRCFRLLDRAACESKPRGLEVTLRRPGGRSAFSRYQAIIHQDEMGCRRSNVNERRLCRSCTSSSTRGAPRPIPRASAS